MDIHRDEQPRRTATDRRHSPTRERLLREVEARTHASTSELVAATGLHENTVRGHLERLHADGHVRREPGEPTGRGRPAIVWRRVDPRTATPYAGLAATLAETLANTSSNPARDARRAATAWGARLADERGDERTDARALVLEIMREQGFAPAPEPTAESEPNAEAAESSDRGHTAAPAPIALHRCPLLAAASTHSNVVCAVHEGMIEGIARTRDASAGARLEPFAEGGVCRLHLQTRTGAAAS